MTEPAQREWMTVAEIADQLRVSEETVRRWVRAGELPALNIGGPKAGYRIRAADLEKFFQGRYGPMGKAA